MTAGIITILAAIIPVIIDYIVRRQNLNSKPSTRLANEYKTIDSEIASLDMLGGLDRLRRVELMQKSNRAGVE